MDGRGLHFHLSGINNQNFLMKDEETGSIWQQVSGKAIFGPMKGRKLEPVFTDELTFERWKQENPTGRVLKPNRDAARSNLYAGANWEKETARLPVASRPDGILSPRTIVLGIQIENISKAYPLSMLVPEKPIVDRIGGTSIVLCMAEDKKSVRCFDSRVNGMNLEFFAKAGLSQLTLTDSKTGSDWNFAGVAVAGPLARRALKEDCGIKRLLVRLEELPSNHAYL